MADYGYCYDISDPTYDPFALQRTLTNTEYRAKFAQEVPKLTSYESKLIGHGVVGKLLVVPATLIIPTIAVHIALWVPSLRSRIFPSVRPTEIGIVGMTSVTGFYLLTKFTQLGIIGWQQAKLPPKRRQLLDEMCFYVPVTHNPSFPPLIRKWLTSIGESPDHSIIGGDTEERIAKLAFEEDLAIDLHAKGLSRRRNTDWIKQEREHFDAEYAKDSDYIYDPSRTKALTGYIHDVDLAGLRQREAEMQAKAQQARDKWFGANTPSESPTIRARTHEDTEPVVIGSTSEGFEAKNYDHMTPQQRMVQLKKDYDAYKQNGYSHKPATEKSELPTLDQNATSKDWQSAWDSYKKSK